MYISKCELEVRYAETDQMGVVYHANYLIWMEVGRTKLIKDLGFSYAGMEKDGVISPVVDINISYKKPLKYGDTVVIHTWVESYNGVRVNYGYEMYNPKGELAIEAQSSHVCVKKESFRPIQMRKYYPEWHDAYETAKK
ncbi:acyl-CoA thioesterase [Metabacillus arenae]|uniref:Acyl-CoA thioesterase n=1 Tax=Metabacillus arenae TaxID=2771434 RepID=A0A926NJQ0_9BACI|nr:thioesterase family protein [Metabacillus arenae]MBD1379347.1 acyl-CoA thioesterase [Metabacillus arenae]